MVLEEHAITGTGGQPPSSPRAHPPGTRNNREGAQPPLHTHTTSWLLRLAKSGRSSVTTVPSSCSSRPSLVTKKLSRDTCKEGGGGQSVMTHVVR